MNAERFAELADAWGGAIARWPAGEQDAAFAFLAASPEAADAILASARALDETLDTAPSPMASHALRERIIAAAPTARTGKGRLLRWLTGAGVGAGLAAATAAGLVAGVQLSLADAAPSEDEQLLAAFYDEAVTTPVVEDGEAS